MNAKFLNPSNYFSAAELAQLGSTFEIVEVRLEDVEDQNNKTKRKGSITLRDSSGQALDKPWLCNVTNTKCLVAMFGDETDRWKGKRVTLHEERVMSFGEWVPGVRVTGSPDIAGPVSVSIKLRKKKAQLITMQRTGPVHGAPGNGQHAPAQPSAPPKPPADPIITFGEKQGWKGKPISSFDSTTLNKILDEGKSWVAQTELASPNEPWLPSVRWTLKKVEEALLARVAPPNEMPPTQTDAPPPF